MLIRTAEPAFLGPGLDSGCAPSGLDSAFSAGELVFMLGVAVSEPVSGVVAGLEPLGPPFTSDWARAPTVPVLLESELVCALAGKASITAKRGTITKLRKCLGEVSTHMSCPLGCAETNAVNIIMSPRFLSRREQLCGRPSIRHLRNIRRNPARLRH